MRHSMILSGLVAATITAGCAGFPNAPGTGDAENPPSYVNVATTEELIVQLVPQDEAARQRNDHPAAFEPAQMAALLMSLRVETDEGDRITLSSPSRLERLGSAMSRALVQAGPRQDVAFVVFRRSADGFFSGNSRYVTAGRAFYEGDTLNIVFGEFDNAFSEFRDLSINKFKYGSRAEARDVGGDRLVAGNAWQWHDGRQDWIEMAATPQAIERARREAPTVIESSASRAAAPLQYGPAAASSGTSTASAPDTPAASPATGTPVSAGSGLTASSNASSVAPAAAGGAAWSRIEDRLTQLKRLREKDLISAQDYQRKKDALLSELP